MSNSTVGIKIANGEFFPILDENFRGSRKKLVLTTVNDNQESVQIDLYKGEGKTVADAAYVGSLVVENIAPAAKGEQDIELIIGIDQEGNLNATAGDMISGERQTLSVSLSSLEEGDTYETPDFELGEQAPSEETSFAEPPAADTSYTEPSLTEPAEEEEEEGAAEKKRAHPLLLVGFVILGLAIIVLVAFLIFQTFQGPEVPPLQAGGGSAGVEEKVAEKEPAPEPAAESSSAEEPAAVEPVPEEVASVPKTEETSRGSPQQEIWYKIQWGDTLWDISDSFYMSPWLYSKIAQDNGIKNPDLIFADSQIRIPSH